jgi:hypothetical protein
MTLTKATMIAIFLLLATILVMGCGDDNSTGPNNNTSAELIGTWLWVSGTINGDPVTFPQISFTDSSQTGDVTFNAGNTWSSNEYYADTVVWTQSGTCSSNGNNLTVNQTMENGVAVDPPEVQTMQWEVIGPTLIISDMEVFMEDTIVVIQTYTKD